MGPDWPGGCWATSSRRRSISAPGSRVSTRVDMAPAVALYRRTGYVEIDDYNGNPDAGWWFEKVLARP